MAGYAAWRLRRAKAESDAAPVMAEAAADPAQEAQIAWEDVTDNVQISVEIGYGLIGLVDEKQGAPLMGRLTGIRRQLSRDLGFVVPPIRVRDNMALGPNSYRVLVSGVIQGEDELGAHEMLAPDSGLVHASGSGRAVKDPTFGLDALWIAPHEKDQAVANGYTVVDASTVLATHVNQIL